MASIRLAIAGLGNCASALVRGIRFYTENEPTELAHEEIGGYCVSDIEPVCGFDIDERKVGETVSDALTKPPNCATRFAPLPQSDAPVYRGPAADGIADHMTDHFVLDESREPVDLAFRLEQHDADVLITYLPVGASEATFEYARACLDAGVAMVNAIPVFIASNEEWDMRFDEAGVPVVGDDIKSQVGATITHRSLVQMLVDRGIKITNMYQLNYGGNTDFRNMLERTRLTDKRISKTEAVNSLLDEPLDDGKIHIGPSDYIQWLDDTKKAEVRIEGRMFGSVPFEIELNLTVEDSPNSAGSAVDAIRSAKGAVDSGLSGSLEAVSAVTMKHPPEQYGDPEALERFNEFLAGLSVE